LTLRPGTFSVEVFGGPFFNTDGVIGFTGGLDLGYKLGPGLVFADARYGQGLTENYKALSFGAGYKLGLISKKKN
jgi:hypothetical protein